MLQSKRSILQTCSDEDVQFEKENAAAIEIKHILYVPNLLQSQSVDVQDLGHQQ